MQRKPKICILTSVHPLFDIRIFYKQAQSLAAAGYDVTLIVPHDHTEPFELDGIRIIPVPKPKTRRQRMAKTVWRLWKLANRQRADVYHFHDPELLFVGVMLRLKGHRVIYDIHENVAKQITMKSWVPMRRLVARIYRWMEIALCRLFPLVLAEASYEPLYPSRWRKVVVQNFPELSLFPSPAATDGSSGRIVYLGGVTRMRGIHVALEAMALLKREGIPFHFDCIGDATESYRAELEADCDRLELTGHVTFHGRMKATEAYRIVSEGAVGLAVLQPSDNYYESFPTKMFEYMALGVPVIASHFPLYVRTVCEARCGLTVDPTKPEQVADAVKYMLTHPEEAKRMGQCGRIAVETKYNWSIEKNKLLALYQDLLNLKESS